MPDVNITDLFTLIGKKQVVIEFLEQALVEANKKLAEYEKKPGKLSKKAK